VPVNSIVAPSRAEPVPFKPTSPSGTLYHVAALAVILLSFAVRVYRLGAVGLEFDEAFSIRTAASSLSNIIHVVATYEPHPPFYYSFLHFWYPVFGSSEFSLRMPTVIANVLTIVVLMRLADSLGWRWPGILAALLFAVNPNQVWYAQEARMYTPVACFGIIAVYFALRTARCNRQRDLAGYVGFMLLALYTHYYAIFLGIFINLLVLSLLWFDGERALPERQVRVRRWLIAQVVVALFYLPWLVYAYRISLYYTRSPIQLPELIWIVWLTLTQFSVGTSVAQPLADRLSLGFLAVLGVGIWGLARPQRGKAFPFGQRSRPLLLVLGYLLLPLTLGFFVSFFRSMFQTRYFLVSAPAFFLLLGIGVAQFFRVNRLLGAAVLVFLVAAQLNSLNNYFFDPRYNKSEPSEAIQRVAQLATAGDGVILDGWDQVNQFWYYHDLSNREPAPGYVVPLSGPQGWSKTFPEIDRIMTHHQGVWLLTYTAPEVDAGRLVETYLAKNYFPVVSLPIITNQISYYVAAPTSPPNVTPLGDSCNNELLLESLASYQTTVRAGAILPLTLRWKAIHAISRDYGVSWRLEDAQGHTVLQRDSQPSSGFAPTPEWSADQQVSDRYGMPLPANLPPGTYTVDILVFNRASGQECVFKHGAKSTTEPLIPVLTIHVLDRPPLRSIAPTRPSHPQVESYGGITLAGYDLDPGPYRPGDTLAPRLYWKVNQTLTGDAIATVRLVDETGAVVTTERQALGGTQFPTSHWQSGREVATYLGVVIPPRATSGTYRLMVSLNGRDIVSTGLADIGPIPIVARPHTFQPPPIDHALQATFGGEISLLGYQSTPEPGATIGPDSRLELTLVWRDLRPIPGQYKVFTHLVGPDGKIYGQEDSIPLAGRAPTDSWIPREILSDHYSLRLAANAPPGVYQLVVGFYNPDNGARLPVTGRQTDMLTIATYRAGA